MRGVVPVCVYPSLGVGPSREPARTGFLPWPVGKRARR
jgi:hypothetical protein